MVPLQWFTGAELATVVRPCARSAALVLAGALAACGGKQPAAEPAAGHAPAAAADAAAPPGAPAPGEWPLPGRDAQGTRYSPLTQLTRDNVGKLAVAWTFSSGTARGFEGQ